MEETQPSSRDNCFFLTLLFLAKYWKSIVTVLGPFVFLPVIFQNDTVSSRCGYVVLIMALYWITDCLPLAVTSFIPVVLFPALSIMSTADICACYMNDTIMVFIGGLSMALAVEYCNLHMRIAIGVMKTVGCSHQRLIGGLILVTTGISMWVSNTAATAMMVPIITAILQELEREGLGDMYIFETDLEDPQAEPVRVPSKVTRGYFLATAYAATFGGTGTLVGTGTNLTFKGIFEAAFPLSEGINFTQWMMMAFPQMILNSVLLWVYIQTFYFGLLRPKSKDALAARIGAEGAEIANNIMKEKWKNLGPITFHEGAIAFLFVWCIFLWVFRKPGFVLGWSELITNVDLKDSNPVIMVTILMFIIPKEPSFLRFCSKDKSKRPTRSAEALMNWKYLVNKMPWGLMFLLGGGFAISRGSNASLLSKHLGEALQPLERYPPFLILAIIAIFVTTITEFTSNVGIANIVLPVIAQMCVAIKLHPIYLMIPATLCCSFSFRLPVGTPPNAIIADHISTRAIMIGGCVPSIFCVLTLLLTWPTWGTYIYETEVFPDWAVPLSDPALPPRSAPS